MTDQPDRFVWLDIETTGLNHLTDVILEVGVRITDLDMQEIDVYDVQVWDSPLYDRKLEELAVQMESGNENARYVHDMHIKSGLWQAAQCEGLSIAEAEKAVADFLKGHGVGRDDPMAGSSVHFDRTFLAEQMPDINDCFGYRNIDVSTVKELCRRFNPGLFAKLEKFGPPQKKAHRVIDDLIDTANELVFYGDNFFHLDDYRELVYS